MIKPFSDEFELIEHSIVTLLGGNEGHRQYITECFVFEDYVSNIITFEELIAFILDAIENDHTGSVEITITGL